MVSSENFSAQNFLTLEKLIYFVFCGANASLKMRKKKGQLAFSQKQ